jgi:hypothetical protein
MISSFNIGSFSQGIGPKTYGKERLVIEKEEGEMKE